MSESPKMGLFGSKDETKETKKETKDDSPDCYTPYCIDSDSETYDTEALSIMDINDIIGVQSEPVSDSTLESEIAALSQMITESKTDTSQSATEIKYETSESELIKVQNPIVQNMDTVEVTDTSDRLTSTLEELEIVCCAEKTSSGYMEQSSKDNLQFSNENTIQDSLQLCGEEKDNDTRDNYEINKSTDSIAIVNTKDVENLNVSQTDTEFIQSSESVILDVKSEENVNKPNEQHDNVKVAVNSEVTIVESENSIRGSLQLIGEAYSSEDSQDTIMNDEELKKINSTISSNENSLIPSEEKKDLIEVCETQDVNNVSNEINNVSSDKVCTEKNETVENEEMCNIEVDSFKCSEETKEELPIISEDAKEIVPTECNVDSPSNIVLQYEEKEEVNTSVSNPVQEELLEEKKMDVEVTEEEESVKLKDCKVNEKMDEENIEPISDICISQEEEHKEKVTEENIEAERDQKTAENMVVEEEISSENEECVNEKKEESGKPVNTLDVENVGNNDQVLNTESNEEIIVDNKIKTSEDKSELEVGTIESNIQSEIIDNSVDVELDKLDSPKSVKNLDMLKDKVEEVELPEEKEEMEIEKLELIETEVEQDLKPIASKLSSEVMDTEISMVSKEDSTSTSQNSTELLLHSENLVETTTHMADNEEIEMKIDEKETLDSVSSEIDKLELKENVTMESVDTTESLVIKKKSEEELKTLESSDTIFNSMEVDLNKDSKTPISTISNDTQSMDITTEENSENKTSPLEDQPLEEINEKIQEIKIIKIETIEDENSVLKKESEESSEIESAMIEETEGSKETENSEQQKDFKFEEKMEEEITIKEEIIEENIIEAEAEEDITIKKEAPEEKITMEKETAEEITTEKGAAEEITIEKETEETTIKKEIEEEITIKKEIEEEITIKKEIEEEITIKKEIEEEITIKKEIEEEITIEEETVEEKVTVKKEIEEENETEKQTQENIVEQIEENREEDSSSKIVVEEQLKEINNESSELENCENICNPVEENCPEESKENEMENKLDIKMDETEEYINEEDLISGSKIIHKDPFFISDHSEFIIVSKEDAKEEYMEEEMSLTLDPEETESQSEIIKSDLDEKSNNEKDIEFSEEIIKESQEDNVKMDEDSLDSLNMEKSSTIEMDTEPIKLVDVEDSESNKIEELSDKQLDDDSKIDTKKDNILETANNAEELFTEEQCQNTQDIVTSILDDVRSATDFKNILSTEANVANEIEEVFQQSGNLPLVEAEIEELTEKLPHDSEDILNKDMGDTMSTQNIDSLEGLLGLDLMPEGEDSTLKSTKSERQLEKPEQLSKVVDMSLLLEQSNHESSDMAQDSDYITHVISSCLDENTPLEGNVKSEAIEDDKSKEVKNSNILKVDEVLISESIDKDENVEDLQKDLREDTDLPENELEMDFEEAPLASVDLEETESKLELTQDILLQSVDQGENLNDAPSCVETSQPSSEISELESAVKFLQESEEQAMDSPLILSPKMVESVVDDISKQADAASLFVPDEDMCENASELDAELQNIATDSISISEAEIISEAAKLESEKKLAEQIQLAASENKFEANDEISEEKVAVSASSEPECGIAPLQNIEMQQAPDIECAKVPETVAALSQNVLKAFECIPKVSILEERLKEPPKIEIPTTDVTKVSMSPTTSKDSLLIQKDAKLIAYQKMLESPKLMDKSEPKIMETPRKDSEKHDFENVGSPRIILKIAKSAITDCGEPRSPKSPKIRSATNSPNPEDSPGQKLGKIKLKLSKSGHPSIISNENIEEVGQWYSEGSSSLSPIGMKIKLSKSGDASIVSSEKHDLVDDLKEGKHKFEEIKRTESPIGMKIKLSKTGDASIVQDCKDMQMKHKDKLDIVQGSPKRTESPIGMKIKLSKSGDASIIQTERQDYLEEYKDNAQIKQKEKHEASYDSPKRTDSPIGMKIKLSKTGDASIVSPDLPEDKEAVKTKEKLESPPEVPRRTESPIGVKIKLAKTKGGASIISMENSEEAKDKLEVPEVPKRTESPLGMKIKLSKSGDASIVHSEVSDEYKEKVEAAQDATKSSETQSGMKLKVIPQETMEEPVESLQEALPKVESPIGMKIKLSKFGDASIIPAEKQEQMEEGKPLQEIPKRTESPLGMKIKLSKTGDASIIQPESSDDANKTRIGETEHSKSSDTSLGMKIKLSKTGDASIVDPEKKDKQQRRRDTESPLEMKIKLSKTGHPTIVACDNQQQEAQYKPKETAESPQNFAQRYKDSGQTSHKESTLKIFKSCHSNILQSNRSELTIEPVQMQAKKPESPVDISPKRKDITIAPIETKKSKLEAQLTQILPEVTIQPVAAREQKQYLFDPKGSAISLQQMNVINQEISITQVRPPKPSDTTMSEKLKDILSKNAAAAATATATAAATTATNSTMNSDCEIIEHRPELIIVNENSNSSQDVVIIEEVSPNKMPEVKVPKKRGRPRRNPLPQGITHPPPHMLMPRDPLSLDEGQQMQQPQVPHFPQSRENERPKRTCRSQKSYAPPKRGRGRGRGKRKLDNADPQVAKKPRLEQDLNTIEASTTAVIMLDNSGMQQGAFGKSPELYKALKQPAMDSKIANSKIDKKIIKTEGIKGTNVANNTIPDSVATQTDMNKMPEMRLPRPVDSKDILKDKKLSEIIPERMQKVTVKIEPESVKSENKDMLVPPGHPNWLTPMSKRVTESATKHENVSTVQVIDEETRMSAESGSRSQTPARNISAPASETIVNEESQGSVLSTATTESEKVKVKNRRMEINFDPDEGPFTVDKIAEYEWPLDRKGETFMIQEQISQYLGVKSFKRKYPDLKRRVVDMEERNYLRENGLVSEAMCDMGLTAVCSSEVLDVMCSDFPDQYEEYRKHMREKQVKEHSKKQKELTAAANAEKNRIDLAEMAVQSALSWNISLNKARRENRKCSLDLQTFTIHVPKKQQKVETERRIGHYPVALIPGQYTDYYREYTPAELRYYPLNTVLYGPMRPNERKFDSQSEGSQSDSDSDSSSDDSSSSSSEGTQDTEGSQSTMDEVDMDIANQKDEIKLKCKMCLKTLNKHSKHEVLIQCGTCNGHVHPSCIDLTLDMVPHIQSYAWQCTDCKTCAQCHDPADEDKMLFCDMCDRGYHIYCVGLRRVPQGRWHCQECAVCANCGSREPGGVNSDRNSVAQWQHEYKKGDKNTRVYVSTLCVPCSKLWRKGRYCPHCSRCHTASRLDLEANLVHCSACDKYLHLGCVETKGVPLDRKNYLCDFCAPNRQQMMKPLISKTLRT